MDKSEPTTVRPLHIRVAAIVIVILLIGTVVECSARVVFAFEDDIKELLRIDAARDFGYAMPDPDQYGLERLRPGYTHTLEEAIAIKEEAGQLLGAERLRQVASYLDPAASQQFLQINEDGYRGPEIDSTHNRTRILTIGDSVTFGFGSGITYPRVLESELGDMGLEIEVVNGGVPGYGTTQVLLRIEDFKQLRPEITTIFIGWADIYSETKLTMGSAAQYFYSIRLVARVYDRVRTAIVGPQQVALEYYNRPKHPDKDAPEVKDLARHVPSAIERLEIVVTEMQSVGSQVVLITLPGLFVMEETPTDLALEIGHLPTFTDNPYVAAKLTERYNEALRQLALKRGLKVIDLEAWSKFTLQPRDAYFYDSVHLTDAGTVLVGIYMAGELRDSS